MEDTLKTIDERLALDAAQLDMDLDVMRTAGLTLGEMYGRYEAARKVFKQAFAEAAHGELKYAGVCKCPDADTADAGPAEPVQVFDIDPNSPLGKVILAHFRKQQEQANSSPVPLADWEADILAAEAANRAARDEERAHTEVFGTPTPPRPDDEGGDKDPICAHCGEAISYVNGSWRHDNGNKGHIADPGVVEGDAPPLVQVLQQPDEPHRALPGDLIAPPAGTPIVITSPPGPNPAFLEQLADDVRRDIKRRRYDSGF